MKKPLLYLAFIPALVLLFTVTAFSQIQVSIPEISAKPGKNVRVPVNVTSITAYSFRSYGMEVQFDSSMIDEVRVFTGGTMSSGRSSADNVISGNVLKVGVAGVEAMSGDGALIYMYFKVRDNVSGRIPLQFRDFFFDQGNTSVETVDGAIVINNAPKITSRPVRKAFVDSLYEYQVTAVDEDGDDLKYSLLLAPDGMEIDSTTGLITWTPDEDAGLINFVRLEVSDGYDTDEQFYVLVVWKKRPKWRKWRIANTDNFENSFTFDSRSHVRVRVNDGLQAGKDISVAYYDTSAPPEVTDKLPGFQAIAFFTVEAEMDSGSYSGELEYNYSNELLQENNIDDESDLYFAYLDTMGGEWKLAAAEHDTVNNKLTVTTRNFYAAWSVLSRAKYLGINRRPKLWGSIIKKAVADSLYSMQFRASDNDDDVLSFSLLRNPSGMTINASSGEITWTPAVSDTGLHRIEVAVSDGIEQVRREYLLLVFYTQPRRTVKTIDAVSRNVEIDVGHGQKSMEIRFGSGDTRDKEVEVTVFEQTAPAEVRVKQTPRKVALYLEIISQVVENTFTAALRIPFSNEQLERADIRDKKKLTLARFRESDSTWQKVPTEIDTTENIAEAITEEFSIWTLMDEEYFEVTDINEAGQVHEINTPVTVRFMGDTTAASFTFVNNSFLRAYIFSGDVLNKTLTITHYSLPSDPSFAQWLYYYDITSEISDFTADLTFGYSDSLLAARGIPEDSVVASYYDSVDSKGFVWHALPGFIDKVNNTLTVTTSHFSKWIVTTSSADFITGVDMEEQELPKKFELLQNYPNPFNPNTIIKYEIPEYTHVSLEIFSVLGQRIKELVNEHKPAGNYQVKWDGTNQNGIPVGNGMYIYRIKAGEFTSTKKMLLLK